VWLPLPARLNAPPSADERRVALERLIAWTAAQGATWNGIEWRVDATGGAGIVATRALAVGDTILTLPRHAMIIDNELDDTATGTLDHGVEPRPRDALAAWLPLELKVHASPWRAYLDTLPVQLDLPMFRGDIDALAGTGAQSLATDMNRDVIATYEQLPPELRARISLADFAWGRAIVMSRGFHAPGSFEHRIALIPLVDIFNHRTDDTGWSFSPYDGNLVVRMERALDAGDDVHFSYGNRSNSQLLVHYGFVLPENAGNEAHLVFEQPPSAPIRVRVRAILDDRFVQALSLARLHACDPVQRERILSELTEPSYIPFIDSATEAAAFDVIATLARRARTELDASVFAGTSAWDRTCQLVREGEREIVDQIIELATAAREYASCTAAELREAVLAIPTDVVGVQRMLRRYLEDLAEAV
jgi:hypothetical protein